MNQSTIIGENLLSPHEMQKVSELSGSNWLINNVKTRWALLLSKEDMNSPLTEMEIELFFRKNVFLEWFEDMYPQILINENQLISDANLNDSYNDTNGIAATYLDNLPSSYELYPYAMRYRYVQRQRHIKNSIYSSRSIDELLEQVCSILAIQPEKSNPDVYYVGRLVMLRIKELCTELGNNPTLDLTKELDEIPTQAIRETLEKLLVIQYLSSSDSDLWPTGTGNPVIPDSIGMSIENSTSNNNWYAHRKMTWYYNYANNHLPTIWTSWHRTELWVIAGKLIWCDWVTALFKWPQWYFRVLFSQLISPSGKTYGQIEKERLEEQRKRPRADSKAKTRHI